MGRWLTLLCEHGELSLDPQNPYKKLDVTRCICTPVLGREVETKASLAKTNKQKTKNRASGSVRDTAKGIKQRTIEDDY